MFESLFTTAMSPHWAAALQWIPFGKGEAVGWFEMAIGPTILISCVQLIEVLWGLVIEASPLASELDEQRRKRQAKISFI